MSESEPFFHIDLGGLSKPATVLIEKISDAIGGIFRPQQIRRIAHAEAEADRIRAVGQIETTELQRRALQRFVAEEAKKQANMESITRKAIPHIKNDAKTESIDGDWISHFFDGCRLVSDEEMQQLWSAVLAGEANSPCSFSKRTVTLVSSLDKKDASLFQELCQFGWMIGDFTPLIYDVQSDIYGRAGIDFVSLRHLDDIGLVAFQGVGVFQKIKLPKRITVGYRGTLVDVEFSNEEGNALDVGHVMLTNCGKELATICTPSSSEVFKAYVEETWKAKGLVVTERAAG